MSKKSSKKKIFKNKGLKRGCHSKDNMATWLIQECYTNKWSCNWWKKKKDGHMCCTSLQIPSHILDQNFLQSCCFASSYSSGCAVFRVALYIKQHQYKYKKAQSLNHLRHLLSTEKERESKKDTLTWVCGHIYIKQISLSLTYSRGKMAENHFSIKFQRKIQANFIWRKAFHHRITHPVSVLQWLKRKVFYKQTIPFSLKKQKRFNYLQPQRKGGGGDHP